MAVNAMLVVAVPSAAKADGAAYTYEAAAEAGPMTGRRSTAVSAGCGGAAGKKPCRTYKQSLDFRGNFLRFLHHDNATEVAGLPGTDVAAARAAHLRAAFAKTEHFGPGTMFLEFGVQNGDSIRLLSSLRPSLKWHGFDSFLGMPEDARDGATRAGKRMPLAWRLGGYASSGMRPLVPSKVRLHPGWFNASVPAWLDGITRSGYQGTHHPIAAFVHFDAHLYSSTFDALDALASRCMLQAGTILAFDELFGHLTIRPHEWRALRETAHEWCFKFRFVTYMLHANSKYGRAAVRIEPDNGCEARSCVRGRGWCWSPQSK